MKKSILMLFIVGMIMAACQKKNNSPSEDKTVAPPSSPSSTVDYGFFTVENRTYMGGYYECAAYGYFKDASNITDPAGIISVNNHTLSGSPSYSSIFGSYSTSGPVTWTVSGNGVTIPAMTFTAKECPYNVAPFDTAYIVKKTANNTISFPPMTCDSVVVSIGLKSKTVAGNQTSVTFTPTDLMYVNGNNGFVMVVIMPTNYTLMNGGKWVFKSAHSKCYSTHFIP